ncbi:MAG: DUF2059 domain-containing protein [Pseudomonadota bacterium]
MKKTRSAVLAALSLASCLATAVPAETPAQTEAPVPVSAPVSAPLSVPAAAAASAPATVPVAAPATVPVSAPVAPPATAPVSAPAPVAPPAVPATPPSAQQLAANQAVKELLAAMKYRQLLTLMTQQTVKNTPRLMRQTVEQSISQNPALNAEQKAAAFASLEKALPGMTASLTALFNDPTLFEEMEASVAPIYTKHFSTAEIGQLTAFYRSGIGMKMSSVMPQIMQESALVSQQLLAPRMAKVMQQLMLDASR